MIETYFNSKVGALVSKNGENGRESQRNQSKNQQLQFLTLSSLSTTNCAQKKVYVLKLDQDKQKKGITQFFHLRIPEDINDEVKIVAHKTSYTCTSSASAYTSTAKNNSTEGHDNPNPTRTCTFTNKTDNHNGHKSIDLTVCNSSEDDDEHWKESLAADNSSTKKVGMNEGETIIDLFSCDD